MYKLAGRKSDSMPVEFHATCSCGYESSPLFDDTVVCRNCDEIVDAPNLPFQYDLSPCPKCSGAVTEEDRLRSLLGGGYLVTDRPSALMCPKCKSSTVQFHLDATISMVYGTEFPQRGDFVHATVQSNGDVEIPGLLMDDVPVTFTNEAEVVTGCRINTRVMSIETAPAQSMLYESVVTRLILKYKGVLRPAN